MSDEAVIAVSFKDLEADEEVREMVEKRCRLLATEFPETTRFEVTIAPDGLGHSAHGHVTGKSTEVATHANGVEMGAAADQLLDKLERKLRRVHDKRIFAHRREAQRNNPKRGG